MQRMIALVLIAMLLIPFAGCLGENDSDNASGTITVDAVWTEIPIETKSQYYSDGADTPW